MTTTRNRRLLFRYAAIFLVGLTVACTGRSVTAQSNDVERRIGKLIEALASPNKAPKYVGPKDDFPFVDIPADYDRDAQRKVLEAWQLLLDEGTDAFPALVAAATDRRYSCTIANTTGDGQRNFTVGGVCTSILRNQIDAICCRLKNSYGPNTLWRRAAMKSGFYRDLAGWWQERRQRTLAELQIEAAEYAIEVLKSEEERAGIPVKIEPSDSTAEAMESEKNQARHQQRLRKERSEDIQELGSLIRQVKVSGQALAPAGIENRYCRMIGLPDEGDRKLKGPHPNNRKSETASKEELGSSPGPE